MLKKQSRLHRRITGTILASLLLLVVAVFVVSVIRPATATAAVGINHQINFQGKLVNTNGTNVTDGSYSIVFSIYTVASGGANIWTETQTVTVTSGLFQVNLGSVTSLPGSVDFNTDSIYLGIKVGADAEMTPRIQFTAVPQAFNSEKLGGLDKTGFIQNQTGSAQAASFNINGTGQFGGSVTAPTLQSAAATALTITGNAASTWSTSAGNITLQAGSGTISLGSTTTLTNTGALTITGGTTLTLGSTGTGAVTIDSGTTGGISIGTNANAKAIAIGNSTGASSVTIDCGTGACNFGTTATAHTTTLGTSTSTSTTALQAGTGGVAIGNNAVANTIQIGNTTGAVAQTINIGNNATASSTSNVLIGSTVAGSTTLQNSSTINLNAGTVVGNATTQNLFNTTATTLNIGGAANTLSLGSATSSTTLNGSLTVANNITGNGYLLLSSDITGSPNVKLQVKGTLNTAFTGSLYGLDNEVNFNPTGASAGTIYGLVNGAVVNGSSLALGSVIGAYSRVDTAAGFTGTINTAVGILSGGPFMNGGLATTYSNFDAAGISTNGGNTTGTITNQGLIVHTITAGAGTGGTVNNYAINLAVPAGSGGTTNNYGINIQGAGGGTKSYALYSSSSASSYFAGKVGFGTVTTPSYAIDSSSDINTATNYLVGGTSVINSSRVLQNVTANASIINAGALAANVGGTGQSSYAVGDLLYAATTTTLGKLSAVASGSCLISQGTNTAPIWGSCASGGVALAPAAVQVDSSTNSSIFINKTGVSGNLFELQKSGVDVFSVGNTGATTIYNTSTAAFQIQNASSAILFNADTTNSVIGVRGSAANDNATLGGELFGSGTFSASTGWGSISGTGAAATATHTSGTTALTTTGYTVTAGTVYQVTYTVNGANGGAQTITPAMGGVTGEPNGLVGSSTDTQTFAATSTATLSFIPTTSWTGTVTSVSIKSLTYTGSTLQIQTSAGVNMLEVRSTAASGSTFVGIASGKYNTSSGTNNTGYGAYSLGTNTTGYNNVALGSYTLQNNASGINNLAIGASALQNNTSGNANVAVGANALNADTLGSYNTAVGQGSLAQNVSGHNNASVGAVSLVSNTTGGSNSVLGEQGLYSNVSGSSNVAVGYSAGYSNTSGSANVFLGYQAGYNETGNNKLYIANSNTSTPLIGGDFGASTLNFNGTVAVKPASDSTTALTVQNAAATKTILAVDTSNAKVTQTGSTVLNSYNSATSTAPYVVGGTNYQLNNPGTSSFSPTSSASTQTGDLVIINLYIEPFNEGVTGASYGTITPPAGFTLATGYPKNTDDATMTTTRTHRQYIYYGYAASNGAQSLNFTGTVNEVYYGASVVSIRGGPTSGAPFADTPVSATVSQSAAGITSTPPVSLTTAGTNSLVLWAVTDWQGSAYPAMAAPAGFLSSDGSPGADEPGTDAKLFPAAGSTGTVTSPRTDNNAGMIASLLSFRSAVAAGDSINALTVNSYGGSQVFNLDTSNKILTMTGTSQSAFQVQNAAGTSNTLVVDTQDNCVAILTTCGGSSTYALTVNGAVNTGVLYASQLNTSSNFVINDSNNNLDGSYTKKYVTTGTVANNDVVIMNSSNPPLAQRTTTARDQRVLGVLIDATYGVVAISGNTLVTADTGAVAIGDQLVTSTTGGQVTVDNTATTGIVGYATQAKAGGSSGLVGITIEINNGQYAPKFQNAADSTTAFQIQNATSLSMFTVDNTNKRIQIGSSTTDANAVLLVQDSYNNATDPTGVAGGMYYNTATSKFRCYENGAWKDCIYGFNTITKTADQAANPSSTVLQNDNTLFFATAANTTYVIDAWIPVDASNATAVGKYAFYPSSFGSQMLMTQSPANATSSNICNLSNAATCGLTFATSSNFIQIRGYFRTGGATGTMQFQFAQTNSAAASFPVIKAGATISWHTTN